MRCRLLTIVALAAIGVCACPAAAAPVKSLSLGVATQQTLDATAVQEADGAIGQAGDFALLWASNNMIHVATRAVGAPFRGPVDLPGALEARNGNRTLEGPVIGIGGGTLVSWHTGADPNALGMLQVALADPGQPVALRAPLTTSPVERGTPRTAPRTAVGPDGTATMAVGRGGGVLVTQRVSNAPNFGPEVLVSDPAERADYHSVRMTQDAAGGVTVTWQSAMPCVAISAPSCKVNRVATRPAGGAFGAPRSLAELSTGPSGLRGADPKRLLEPDMVADEAGRTVLAWQRTDPGRFDAMEVSVGSASRGYSAPVALPGTAYDVAVQGARCTATTGRDPSGTNYLFGALPASDGRETVLVKRVSGCGSAVLAYTLAADGTVAGAGRVLVSGIGLRAPRLLRRGAKAALVVQSVRTIRVAFSRGGAFGRLQRVGPRTVPRFGPSALMRDGSLLVEYGRGCASATDSTVSVVKPRSRTQVTRRVGRCGVIAPTVLDNDGGLLTVTLGASLDASVSCPIPAAIAAQRANRSPRCG